MISSNSLLSRPLGNFSTLEPFCYEMEEVKYATLSPQLREEINNKITKLKILIKEAYKTNPLEAKKKLSLLIARAKEIVNETFPSNERHQKNYLEYAHYKYLNNLFLFSEFQTNETNICLKPENFNPYTIPFEITKLPHSTLENLPTSLLKEIIFATHPKSWNELNQLAHVSKTFHSVISSSDFLKSLFEKDSTILWSLPYFVREILIPYSDYQPEVLTFGSSIKNNRPSPAKNAWLRDSDLCLIAGKKLKKLSLEGVAYTIYGFRELLTRSPYLTSIELNMGLYKKFSIVLETIATKVPQLKKLKLINCSSLNDSALMAFASLKNKLQLTSFEIFNSTGNNKVTDLGCRHLLNKCENLTKISFVGFPQVSINSLDSLIREGFPNHKIKQLNFSFCTDFTNNFFNFILPELLPNLEELEIGACTPKLSDELTAQFHETILKDTKKAAKNYFFKENKLKKIRLYKCLFFNQRVLEKLSQSHSLSLTDLTIFKCGAFSQNLLVEISKFSNLKSCAIRLAVNNPLKFKAQEIKDLKISCHALKKLDINFGSSLQS